LNEALDLDLQHEEEFEYSVTWLDALAGPSRLGRGMLMLGNHAGVDRVRSAGLREKLEVKWNRTVTAPRGMPGIFLNKASNLALNTAYANRFAGKSKEGLVGIESWFYPLDRVRDWNRFYGKSGFVEFQCSLPSSSARAGMKRLLAEVRRAGQGSFLAVYKRVGNDGSMMPFASSGFTLAMDFGLRARGVIQLIAQLIQIVREHGGRLYLSKDACMKPDDFHATYPEYSVWNSVRKKLDPEGMMASHMSRRLEM
jgi:decaprenylphospho-beta-D-ribofuranose 2-oxidase